MKLQVNQNTAFVLSTLYASFFVVAVYIWKPFVRTPYNIKQLQKKKQHQLKQAEWEQLEDYLSRQRTRSVGTLCVFAFASLFWMADRQTRPEVGVFKWFGLDLDIGALKACVNALVLNTVLFSGEVYQIIRGMTKVMHTKVDFTTVKTILFAPLFEEFIYRSCLLNIFIEAGEYSPTMCVLVTPFFFAISHLH
jgi:membrane protease YdiL (CAAX protease family)